MKAVNDVFVYATFVLDDFVHHQHFSVLEKQTSLQKLKSFANWERLWNEPISVDVNRYFRILHSICFELDACACRMILLNSNFVSVVVERHCHYHHHCCIASIGIA